MKRLILVVTLCLTSLLLISIEIADELWLNAVKIKEQSAYIYPTTTNYHSLFKDKEGNVKYEIDIFLEHYEEDGEVVNRFVEGFSKEKPLTEKDQPVPRYLSTAVLMKKEGVFQSTISDDFKLSRLANETIDGKEYAKYEVSMRSWHEKREVKSVGFAWLDAETGVPFKLHLNIDPSSMMIKSLDATTYYSLSEEGYLTSDKLVTEIVVDIFFKKLYVTQTVTKRDFKKLGSEL